jgi:two-component sensor histidine kinase
MSLLVRLIVLVLVAVTPAVALQVWGEVSLSSAREAEVRASVLRQAEALAEEHEQLIASLRSLMVAVAQLPAVRRHETAACAEALGAITAETAAIVNIYAALPDGQVFCSAVPHAGAGPVSVADQGFFRAARTGQFVVGDLGEGQFTHSPVLPLALAFDAEDGTPGGVIVISIDANALAHRLDRRGWSNDLAFLISDRKGAIVARQPDHLNFVGRPLPQHLQGLLAPREPGVVETTGIDGISRIIGYVPPPAGASGLYFGVGVTRQAAFASLNETSNRTLLLIIAGALLTLALAVFMGQRALTRPLSRLSATAQRYAEGDWSAPVPEVGSAVEMQNLAAAMRRMSQATQDALAQKDMLLREVHHRVMNSFAMLTSLIALQARDLADPRGRAALEETRNRVAALSLAYRRLHVASAVAAVTMGAYLEGLCDELSKSLLASDDARRIVVSAADITVSTQQAIALGLIVTELVTNALKHAFPDDRAGTVSVSLCSDAAGCTLSVEDDGVGLPAGFTPETSNGLGMRVVLLLTRQFGGTITVSPQPRGCRFVVTLPAATAEARAPAGTAAVHAGS